MKARLELVYHELARRMLLKQSDEEIALHMGLKIPSVKRIQDNPQFREILEQVRTKTYASLDQSIEHKAKTMTERISEAAETSFDRLMAILQTSQSENIVRDVAQDFMDRAGYGKTAPANQTVVNIGTLEAGVLVDALKREQEARALLHGKDPKALAKPIQEHAAQIKEQNDAGRNNSG